MKGVQCQEYFWFNWFYFVVQCFLFGFCDKDRNINITHNCNVGRMVLNGFQTFFNK